MKRFWLASAAVAALVMGSSTQARADTICYGSPSMDQEVPPPGTASNGGGLVVAVLSTDMSRVTILVSLFDMDLTQVNASHIHNGPTGTAGPVIFDLGSNYSTLPVTAVWSGPTADQVMALLTGNLYYNVHTNNNPGGEIRGQLSCLP